MAVPYRDPSKLVTVDLISNRRENSIATGQDLPYLVQAEQTASSLVILDSKDRVAGSVSEFRCDLFRNLPRPRYVRLSRCCIPKCNNVNNNNNQLQITTALGTTAVFSLDQGIYSPTTLSNELTSKINAAYAAVPIADTVTTSYDPNTRTFSISSTGAVNFYIHSECSFITHGTFLAPFESLPSGSATAKSTNYSGISCMLYTRYLIVQSYTLSQWIYGTGASSRGSQAVNMIASVDLTGIYVPEDFDVGVPYAGVLSSLPVDAMNVSVLNSQRLLPSEIDIRVVDEYGLLYERALELSATYPTNDLGMSFYFTVTY